MSAERLLREIADRHQGQVELSLASGTPAVGILLPISRGQLWESLGRLWGRESPAADQRAPRQFIRCDVERREWRGVTWYCSAPLDQAFAGIPGRFVSTRWLPDRSDETSHYFWAGGLDRSKLSGLMAQLAGRVGLPIGSATVLSDMASLATRAGWPQTLACTKAGAASRVKVTVAPLHAEVAPVAESLGAAELAVRFKTLRAPLGYAGFSVGRDLGIDLRLYSRPLQVFELGRALAAVPLRQRP